MARNESSVMIVLICTVLASCAPAPPLGAPSGDPLQPQAPTDSYVELAGTAQNTDAPVIPIGAPHTSNVDLTRLELGDGKYSQTPQIGYVYSCQPQFNVTGTGRQGMNGMWLNGDGTWDVTKKAIVDGSATWPYSFTMAVQGDQRVFVGNDLPAHPTGNYPIAANDDAFAYDHNPNSISAQTVSFSVPANPRMAAQPTCVGGEVGIMLSGVVLFSAFDADGRDAPAREVQDACDGHPQVSGFYHYHSLSDCLDDTASGHSGLMGYAFDGFGMYGYYGEDGAEVTNEDLDACHGHNHVVEWDGRLVEMYHYHATHQFPYMAGCFMGAPSVRELSVGNEQAGKRDGQTQPGGGMGQPPQEAIDACAGRNEGASCSVGPTAGTCQMPANATQLACIPAGGPPP